MTVASLTESQRTTITISRLLDPQQSGIERLDAHRRAGGYAPEAWALTPAELLRAVDVSGLRGRGGSMFPTGRKWQAVAERRGPKVLLVNAAESEPASAKDRTLLLRRPHLVLEGALLACRAVGADEIVVYLHDHDMAVRDAVDAAFDELRQARFKLPRRRVVTAPAGYVAGEESAAVRRANGGPARPTAKPPRPFERGVRNRPTLVNNVETLANVPLIATHGPEWFRALGVPSLPGTILLTLSGSVRWPGVYEVASGVPLRAVIDELGGGLSRGAGIQAVLVGGYFAGWLPGSAVESIRLDPHALSLQGTAIGSAAIVVVPDDVCGLTQAARLLRFFADESARQCGPCTFGTPAMAEVFERLLHSQTRRDDLDRLRVWTERMLPGRGACGHLDGAVWAARSALNAFADDIAAHSQGRDCGRPRSVVLPGLADRVGVVRGTE